MRFRARVARQPIANFILDKSPRSAKFAQAVEVADQRHVRIDRVRLLAFLFQPVVPALPRTEQCQVHAQHRNLRAAALRRDSDIQTSVRFDEGERLRKERVATVRSRWREDVHRWPIEQCA